MRLNTEIKMSVQRMVCTACGSEANASCNCGKPYVPQKQRAVEAVQAHPEKSDYALSAETGIGRSTIQRAREEITSPDGLVERIGRDGIARRLPQREPVEDDDDIEPDNRRGAFILRADQARALASYSGPTDAEILKFAQAAAQAWQELVADLQRKLEH